MASSFAQSHSELQFAHHYTRQMHGNQLSMASPYSRPSALSPTPCLPPPQDSSTIKLNIIQNGEWRSYKVPFTRVKSYSVSQRAPTSVPPRP